LTGPERHNFQLVFELLPIPAVSPSLAETLRNCPLQAGLSRIAGIRHFLLGNPKAWLGIAYHEVLEKLWTPGQEHLTNDELVDYLWTNAVTALQQRVQGHALDRRFSSPEKWPGYYLVRASVLIRARQALEEHPRQTNAGPSNLKVQPLREQALSAMEGKLVGKPDVLAEGEIRDYKSGIVHEDSADGQKVAKEAYVRQLRLYGHLVRENSGHCPPRGKLMPMQGETIEIELDASACATEAQAAVNLLDMFNASLAAATDVSELANASPAACRWCQYKTICPAFWANVDASWVGDLGSAAICGVLCESPKSVHGGRAFSLSLNIEAGTVGNFPITIGPFDQTVFGEIANYQAGERIRIVNLYARKDGQLAPTSTTLCVRESDCPTFKVPSG